MALKIDMDEGGTRYENEGGPQRHGLQVHEHPTRADCHTVEVIEGEVVLFFDSHAVRLKAGDVYRDIDVAQRHGIWPLGPATWYNRRFGPKADWFDGMSDAEKHTRVNQPVDLPRWAHEALGIPL